MPETFRVYCDAPEHRKGRTTVAVFDRCGPFWAWRRPSGKAGASAEHPVQHLLPDGSWVPVDQRGPGGHIVAERVRLTCPQCGRTVEALTARPQPRTGQHAGTPGLKTGPDRSRPRFSDVRTALVRRGVYGVELGALGRLLRR